MVEILGADLGVSLPSITGGNIGTTITWMLVIFLFMVAVGIGIFLFIMSRKFNKKIILFENVSGQGYIVTYRDIGRAHV